MKEKTSGDQFETKRGDQRQKGDQSDRHFHL